MLDVDHLEALTVELHTLAADGVDGLDGHAKARAVLVLARIRELAECASVTALGALDRDRFPDLELGMTTVGWMATHTKVSYRTARWQLATARRLEGDLAPAAEAWLAGRIGGDHVRVLCGAANPRIRDEFAEHLEVVIGSVANTRFDVWADEVRRLARELDADGLEPGDPSNTSLSWSRSDVFAVLRGQFSDADAEVFEQTVGERADELFLAQCRAVADDPTIKVLSRDQWRGRALILCLIDSMQVDPDNATAAKAALHLVIHADVDGTGTDGPDPDGPDADGDAGGDDRPHPGATDGPGSGDAPVAEPGTTTATSAGTDPASSGRHARTRCGWPTSQHLADASWRIMNPDGRPLDPAGLDALLGNVEIHPVLVDGDDNPIVLGAIERVRGPADERTIESLLFDPASRTRLRDAATDRLHLGRSHRLAPSDLRRVVLIRDGGCIHPGCDCPVGWADIHHIVWWEHGGVTDIENLAALCRRHHGVAHRNGWSLEPAGDGWFVWTTPSGLRMWSQRHGTQRAGPLPPATRAA